MCARFDANADNGFAEVAKIVEAMIAKFQAKLVLALGLEAAVAFIASGEFRALVQFANVECRMDFADF
jgi:hypothetical protein